LFEVGFMGNTGQKQYGSVLLNQPRLPQNKDNPELYTTRMPYPNLPPGFSQNTNYQWSNYNAGYVKIEQRLWHGLSYTVAYTYSKLMDSGAAGMDSYNRQLEREPAPNNVPHNFIASYVWQIPVGKGKAMNIQNKILDGVIGGWEMSGITNFISGMNFTIVAANDPANVLAGEERANATTVKPQKLDPRTNGLLGFVTAAYSTPLKGYFGNLGRNTQRGFGTNQWDVSFSKNFGIPKMGEQSRLQIRAEFFNFFNHTQFNNPIATVNVSTFGLVNSTRDPRILQLGGKLYW